MSTAIRFSFLVGLLFGGGSVMLAQAMRRPPDPIICPSDRHFARYYQEDFEALCYVDPHGACHGVVVMKRP